MAWAARSPAARLRRRAAPGRFPTTNRIFLAITASRLSTVWRTTTARIAILNSPTSLAAPSSRCYLIQPALHCITRPAVERWGESPMRLATGRPRRWLRPTPVWGAIPLRVHFAGAGSSDPDNDFPLTFGWNFGDGSPPSNAADPIHIYSAGNIHGNTHCHGQPGSGISPQAGHDLSGRRPASAADFGTRSQHAVLCRPGDQTQWTPATDPEDGALPASSLKWNVLLVHVPFGQQQNKHTHPFFSGTGNNLDLPLMPPPEDLDAAPLSYLEIQLTATDAQGLTQAVTQTLQPNRMPVTFAAGPDGLRIDVNNTTIHATQGDHIVARLRTQHLHAAIAAR